MSLMDRPVTDVMMYVVASDDEAPHYGKNHTPVRIDRAVIIKETYDLGAPTVDLHLTDAEGNPFIARATGDVVLALAGVMQAFSDSREGGIH